MHVLRRVPLVLSIAALVTAGVSAPAGARQTAPATATDAVSAWNASAGKAAVAACISPEGPGPAEARLYAMAHVAIHDALNAIDRRSRPYAYDARAQRGTSPNAAVAAAAHAVLVPGLRELSPTPFRRASTPASPASKRTTWPRSPMSAMGGPRLRGVALGEGRSRGGPCAESDGPADGVAGPGLRLRPGHRSRRVSLHTRHPVRVRSERSARPSRSCSTTAPSSARGRLTQ